MNIFQDPTREQTQCSEDAEHTGLSGKGPGGLLGPDAGRDADLVRGGPGRENSMGEGLMARDTWLGLTVRTQWQGSRELSYSCLSLSA
jgi:hypothetical protein